MKKNLLVLSGIFLCGIFLASCDNECENTPLCTGFDLSEVEIVQVYQTKVDISIDIDDEDVEKIDKVGFVWNTSTDASIGDEDAFSISSEDVVEDFYETLSDLTPGNTYYFKAFAQSGNDVFYSDEQSFTTIDADGFMGTVEDVDGNIYATKVIGGREWMLENLRTKHFCDSSAIPSEIATEEWGTLTTAALGWYDYDKIEGFESDAEILETYGALYNWYAVNDERQLCPTGWHVPSDEEWRLFEVSLGMSEAQSLDIDYRGTDEGAMIKITATAPRDAHPRWDSGNKSNNSTGFSVIPGGARYESGNYGYKGFFGYLWTASEVATNDAWGRILIFSETSIGRDIVDKNMGMNIRCIKNDH